MRSKFKWIFTLLVAFTMQFSFAQEKTVTGTVTDGKLPLSGANVKNGSRGVQTDADGKFAIKANVGDKLSVSFAGYQTQTSVVGSNNNYNFQLKSNTLDEVVVIGYNQTKKKNEITGNVSKVNSDIIKQTPTVSIDQALQGKVAGLTIATTSGTPGSVQNIRIRGVNSLYASNEPLYVIDGIPMVSGSLAGDSTNESTLSALASVSSDNIESMTVLKDASATAVYGARGTNGVILITTKKGKTGKTRFSATSTFGFQNNSRKGLAPLTGAQKKTLLEDAVYNSFGTTLGITRDQAYQAIVDNDLAPTLVEWVNNGSNEYNWPKLVTNKNALLTSLDFNASGGDGKQTFYAGIGYNKTVGTVIGADFKRITGQLNYSNQLTEKARFTNNLSVSNMKQNGNLEQSAFFSNPNLTKYFMNPWINPYNPDGSLNTTMSGTTLHNTLYSVANNRIENDVLRIMNNSTINYSLFKNLKFTSSLGLDYSITAYRNKANPFHGDGVNVGGYIQESIYRVFKYVSQNSVDYNFKINDNNRFETKLLMEWDKTKFRYLYGYGENLVRPEYDYINGTSANWDSSSSFEDQMNLAYLGLVNYKFKNKYIVDLTGRHEKNSKFNKNGRKGNFYSIGLAWNLSEEDFLKGLEYIDELRLRGSYGITGNSAINNNTYQSTIGSTSYNGSAATFPSNFGGIIGWENAKKRDIGIDFSLFKRRLTGNVSYYHSTSYNMLIPTYPLPNEQGFTTQTTNAGTLSNKGFEAKIDYQIIDSKDFKWNIGGNIGTVRNRVEELSFPNGDPLVIPAGAQQIEAGHPAYEWYMRKWAGVDPATGSPLWYINGVDGATTNDYNQANVAYQGASALPTFSGGVNNRFDYKNFYLDVNFYFVGGNKVFQDWSFYTSHSGTSSLVTYNGTEDLLDRWQTPGDITDVPKMEYNGTGSNASRTSTRFLYDGDYIRLRDITFGYNFNSKLLKDLKIDGLSMYVRGTNLVTWVKDSRLKYDPEVAASGFTDLTSPPVKSVVFSVNVKF